MNYCCGMGGDEHLRDVQMLLIAMAIVIDEMWKERRKNGGVF
jgi:hypothetical protein